jgi:hypothetical protein
VGSNPAVYWMDVSEASYYILIEKKKNKGSQTGANQKFFFEKMNIFSLEMKIIEKVFLILLVLLIEKNLNENVFLE